MAGSYIYRLDDITKGMNWDQFNKYINLFKSYGIKPLLGIIPDNRDPFLKVHPDRDDFWDVMRKLQEEKVVEFAQHGFQHIYSLKNRGMLGRKYGIPELSEFAGLPYGVQVTKIAAGREILQREEIYTDIWIAPGHTFDVLTLKALKDTGFTAVSDGIALYPCKSKGLVFIPQLLWEPGRIPAGVSTICLHVNNSTDELYEKVRSHLESGQNIVSAGDVLNSKATGFLCILNLFYVFYYIVRKRLRTIRNRIRGFYNVL